MQKKNVAMEMISDKCTHYGMVKTSTYLNQVNQPSYLNLEYFQHQEKGKLLNNLSVWTQKLAEAALVNPNNFWGQLSFPVLGVILGTGRFLVIHKTRGFICFLKTFTNLKLKTNNKTYKNDDNG